MASNLEDDLHLAFGSNCSKCGEPLFFGTLGLCWVCIATSEEFIKECARVLASGLRSRVLEGDK